MSADFIRDNTALYDDKSDVPGRSPTDPTHQWSGSDAQLVKSALESIRTYLRTGTLDVPAVTTIPSAVITSATVGDLNVVANTDPLPHPSGAA